MPNNVPIPGIPIIGMKSKVVIEMDSNTGALSFRVDPIDLPYPVIIKMFSAAAAAMSDQVIMNLTSNATPKFIPKV